MINSAPNFEDVDLRIAMDSQKLRRCQGECAECRGELEIVRVTHPSHDWGWFCYCEAAIAEDVSRGLVVRKRENNHD